MHFLFKKRKKKIETENTCKSFSGMYFGDTNDIKRNSEDNSIMNAVLIHSYYCVESWFTTITEQISILFNWLLNKSDVL